MTTMLRESDHDKPDREGGARADVTPESPMWFDWWPSSRPMIETDVCSLRNPIPLVRHVRGETVAQNFPAAQSLPRAPLRLVGFNKDCGAQNSTRAAGLPFNQQGPPLPRAMDADRELLLDVARLAGAGDEHHVAGDGIAKLFANPR